MNSNLYDHSSVINQELNRLTLEPRFESGYTYIFNKPFKYNDSLSFVVTYKELFQQEIYKFNPSASSQTIIDCGANMGLSVLYFAQNYPHHKIIAFEPDTDLFNIVKENINCFKLTNVEIINKAVWDSETVLTFYTDGGMGGRANSAYKDQKPKFVESVPLSKYLTKDVDFLKIDIEGAEKQVLNSCSGLLRNVNNLFFEYHNPKNEQQYLHNLLDLCVNEGFKYHIKESCTKNRPFVDDLNICETFDMALNIFCSK